MTERTGDGGQCPLCPGDRFVARVLLDGHLRMHELAAAAGLPFDDWLAQQREDAELGRTGDVFPFPVVVDDRLPSNVAVVRGETTAYVDLPPRRPPVELLVEGWDGLTELLDPVLATLTPEQITPIMARLMLIGMAVEELRA